MWISIILIFVISALVSIIASAIGTKIIAAHYFDVIDGYVHEVLKDNREVFLQVIKNLNNKLSGN